MNPFKTKEKKPKPQWVQKGALCFIILMLLIWLVNIVKPEKKTSPEDTQAILAAAVDSAVTKVFDGKGSIVFRAEPVNMTYMDIPDETELKYNELKSLKENLEDLQEISESTEQMINELDRQMAECRTSIKTKHSPNDIHYIVQKIKVKVNDTLLVHAFAKVTPDFSSCELETVYKEIINN